MLRARRRACREDRLTDVCLALRESVTPLPSGAGRDRQVSGPELPLQLFAAVRAGVGGGWAAGGQRPGRSCRPDGAGAGGDIGEGAMSYNWCQTGFTA